MPNDERIKDIEYLLGKLAKFHGEPNTAFYKELSEELFVRYAGFEDEAAGYTTLSVLTGRSFEKQGGGEYAEVSGKLGH